MIGIVDGTAIKELKYKGFRFYFIVNNHEIMFFNSGEITKMLIKFIKMSENRNQQTTIDEIKRVLRIIGPNAF